jgi:hypothetical protein
MKIEKYGRVNAETLEIFAELCENSYVQDLPV